MNCTRKETNFDRSNDSETTHRKLSGVHAHMCSAWRHELAHTLGRVLLACRCRTVTMDPDGTFHMHTEHVSLTFNAFWRRTGHSFINVNVVNVLTNEYAVGVDAWVNKQCIGEVLRRDVVLLEHSIREEEYEVVVAGLLCHLLHRR